MLLFPAIDLLGGKAVRLFQGDYAQSTVFGENPADFAAKFAMQGAQCLHLVDLDGAKGGAPQNFSAVQDIVKAAPNMLIELGGGIRTEQTVEKYLEMGISRVILGTAALKDAEFTKRMVKQYGERIAVGVDARDGKVAVEGWLSTSNTDSIEFCRTMQDIGVRYIIYTDIARDGAQRGSNIEVYEQLAELKGMSFTASGGVSSVQEIARLRDMGLYAAILGRALYEGTVQLKDVLAIACGQN